MNKAIAKLRTKNGHVYWSLGDEETFIEGLGSWNENSNRPHECLPRVKLLERYRKTWEQREEVVHTCEPGICRTDVLAIIDKAIEAERREAR